MCDGPKYYQFLPFYVPVMSSNLNTSCQTHEDFNAAYQLKKMIPESQKKQTVSQGMQSREQWKHCAGKQVASADNTTKRRQKHKAMREVESGR